jgi:aspartyl-tRNA(Asn)/glutamyl-tRNA(Gln) amidotransferase subunit A
MCSRALPERVWRRADENVIEDGMTRVASTVLELAAALDAGRTTSRALVDEALARIADPAGEGRRSFRSVAAASAREAAEAQDRLRRAGYRASPLAGLPISLKDLFDIAGEITLAGSRALDDAAPAARDAAVVARLKAAGAIILGRTNMTEFAFSGVGINPHYGTPGNPWDRRRVPGGSSSGAGVAVADGQGVLAIGTDTGGSVRIPAALCGLVGFKPTQYRVPRDGAIPLSTTLDSIGPLANSVACCAIADAVMAGEPATAPEPRGPRALRLAVPRQSLFFDELDAEVASGFERACAALAGAGAAVDDLALPELADYAAINAKGGFSPPEAYAWHADLIARRGADYDQRVRQRIARGAEMSAPDYIRLIADRARFIAAIDRRAASCDALLVPTVAMIAPPISAFANDADFFRLNARILRNPSVVNFLDRCAVTLPIAAPGAAPVGLMLIGGHGADRDLLALAQGVEAALAPLRRG